MSIHNIHLSVLLHLFSEVTLTISKTQLSATTNIVVRSLTNNTQMNEFPPFFWSDAHGDTRIHSRGDEAKQETTESSFTRAQEIAARVPKWSPRTMTPSL